MWINPKTEKWQLKQKPDYRMERQFAPKMGERTRDEAPSDEAGTETCYTSCLLRIRLVRKDATLAIEVQISNLSFATIMRRTIDYDRRGIYVLWLLQWTPKLDQPRYTPRLWEKWIHTSAGFTTGLVDFRS